MRDPQSIPINEDAQLIPLWSMIVAGIAFIVVEYYFWYVLPLQRHHPPAPLGLRTYINLSWGILASLYFLMVGYVSKDAPRRSMSMRFWMLICFVLPGGIGAVLYFLLRLPIISKCAACGTHVLNDFHFCPQCNYQLTASCGNCFRSVRITDLYCTGCGHELAEDQMPSRLRVMVD
ncbi:zinc ribbon domain-containing protein [Acidicapsa ligni]|uniref:zinc ribbon domain-containing protein n=1 Tax=Acidicapsa ligni TaxID=542300 RepID=UPI0021E05427|nr:zinc ribbon domain-containing protein [Acidicapsa ligni]